MSVCKFFTRLARHKTPRTRERGADAHEHGTVYMKRLCQLGKRLLRPISHIDEWAFCTVYFIYPSLCSIVAAAISY